MRESHSSIVRRFLALARRDRGASALVDANGEILATRASLAGEILDLEEKLRPWVGPHSTVVLSLPNGAAFVRAFGALRALGAHVALVDAASPASGLEEAAGVVGALCVIATPERSPFAEAARVQPGVALALSPHAPVSPLPHKAAILKLTSGSTGHPRALVVGERQLAADSAQILRTMGIRARDVTLAAIPLTHSYGIGNCLIPLFLAGTPLAFPTCALPAALAHTLASARVEHFPAVPAMVRALATLGDLQPLPALRVCLTAGAPLAPDDAAAFHQVTGHKVHVFYGASECGGITYDRSTAPVHAPGAVGTSMDRVTVTVVDEQRSPLPPGREGRIMVTSLATAIAAVPPVEGEDVLVGMSFLTGDLGVQDEHGALTLTGRLAEHLNVAGKKVHPEEVRRVLEAIPGVRHAVVAGLPDAHRGQLVAAVIATVPGANVTVHGVLRACRERLAPHKVPRRLVIVDELPFSERGKVRQDAVLRLLSSAGDRHGAG